MKLSKKSDQCIVNINSSKMQRCAKSSEASQRPLYNLNQCNYTLSRSSKRKDNSYILQFQETPYIDNSKIMQVNTYSSLTHWVKTQPNKTRLNPFKLKVNEVKIKLIQKPTVPQFFMNL